VTDGGKPRRIDVPIEMPEGVSRAGVFGNVSTEQFSNFPTQRTVTSLYSVSGVVNAPSPPPAKSKRLPVNGRIARGVGGGSGGSVAAPMIMADSAEAIRVVSPEEQKRRDLLTKFHPTLLAVIDRLKEKNSKPGVGEDKFVRDGKAEIQIWLTDKSAENLAKLKALGFEVLLDPKTSKMVIGRLSIDKLAALEELKFVRYVGPQMAG
jgi:hypothetical protein